MARLPVEHPLEGWRQRPLTPADRKGEPPPRGSGVRALARRLIVGERARMRRRAGG